MATNADEGGEDLDLIIVCCHSIFLGKDEPTLESSWNLAPFQRSDGGVKPGEHETFLLHILVALFHATQSTRGWIVFSGGPTATNITTQSEARSYFDAFEAMVPSGHPWFQQLWDHVKPRVLLEEQATDSFQNLLFSIITVRKRLGAYPKYITIITHAFKSRRFLELHAPAIRWPRKDIAVHGVNPSFSLADLNDAEEKENENAFTAFKNDPYGTGKNLLEKRRARGWNDTRLDTLGQDLEPSVRQLLGWEGGKSGQERFPFELPWTYDGPI
jgi:hypothetical protein